MIPLIILSCAKNVELRKLQWKYCISKLVEKYPQIHPIYVIGDSLNPTHAITSGETSLLFTKSPDDYKGLTLKMLEVFKWLLSEIDFKFMIKIDDDSFIDWTSFNPDFFFDKAYAGYMIDHSVKKWYLINRYASGAFYSLSKESIRKILATHANRPVFLNGLPEDAIVGFCLRGVEKTLLNNICCPCISDQENHLAFYKRIVPMHVRRNSIFYHWVKNEDQFKFIHDAIIKRKS